jgi:hypothetical protein
MIKWESTAPHYARGLVDRDEAWWHAPTAGGPLRRETLHEGRQVSDGFCAPTLATSA